MTTGSRNLWLSGPNLYQSEYGEGVSGHRLDVSWTGSDRAKVAAPRRRRWSFRVVGYEKRVKIRGVMTTVVKYRRIKVYEGDNPRPPRSNEPHSFHKSWTEYNLYPLGATRMRWDGYVPATDDHWYPVTITAKADSLIPSPAYGWTSDDDFKLLDKLQTRVQGSSFNMASFLGAEGSDTVRFIGDTANRIYRALVAVRRGNLNRAVAQLRQIDGGFVRKINQTAFNRRGAARIESQLDVYRNALSELVDSKGRRRDGWRKLTADNWLEFHLAAEPLMGDVKAAAEQLAHHMSVPFQQSYRAQREVRTDSIHPSSSWAEAKSFYRKQVIAYLSEPQTVAQLSGVLDPEVVLWNAIPLSFVVDWFIPIGDYLTARAFVSHLSGTFVTSTKQYHVARSLTAVDPASRFPDRVFDNEVFYTAGSFDRAVGSSLDVPRPRFNPLGAVSSWQRAATAVALISGLKK